MGVDLDWDSLGETQIGPIFDAIEAAPDEVRAEVERDFREVWALADEGGTKTLIQEGLDSPRHVALCAAFSLRLDVWGLDLPAFRRCGRLCAPVAIWGALHWPPLGALRP